MKKHVVLLSSAAAAPTLELIESLSSSGIAVRIEGLHNSEVYGEQFSTAADFPLANPSAILYEIAPETRVAFQEAIDGGAIAGGDPPTPILLNQILLHHQFAISVEGNSNMGVHDRIDYGQVSHDAHGANFDPLELIQVARPLEFLHETFARNAAP